MEAWDSPPVVPGVVIHVVIRCGVSTHLHMPSVEIWIQSTQRERW